MAKGVTVDFNANLATFEDKINKAIDKLKDFGDESEAANKKSTKAFKSIGYAVGGIVATGVLATGGLVALTKSAHTTAAALETAADKTGFSVERFQELRFAADQTNVSMGELDSGLEMFNRRLGEARMGMGEASKVYSQLGIDLSQSNDEIFRQAVETIGAVEDQANKIALTSKLFGESSSNLANTFKDGARGIDEFAEKARNLGLVLDEDLVRGASAANQEFETLKQVLSVQTTKIILELAPAIVDIGNAFAEAAPKIAAFVSQFSEINSQTRLAAEETVKTAQETYGVLQAKLARRLEIQNNPQHKRLFADVFLPSEEDIRADMAVVEKQFSDGIKRLAELNTRNTVKPTALPTSNLFDGEMGGGNKKPKKDPFEDAIASMEQTIALLGVETQYEKTLWDVQSGRYKDLKDGQKAALLDAAKRLDQKNLERQVQDELNDAQEKAAQKAEEYNQKLEDQADRWRDLLNPANGVYDQMAELDTLLEKGKISWDTYGDAMFHVMAGLEEEATKTEDKWKDLGLTFSSAFEDAVVNGERLSDVLQGLEKDIVRIVTRKLGTEPLGNFVSSFAESFLPSFDGGGFTGLGSRSGGMDGKGGFLAMLHPNEDIIDRTKTNRGSSGMRIVNNITVSAPNGQISTESMNQLQTKLAKSMQRSLARNS